MLNRIIKIIFVCLMFLAVLSVGGYSFDSFSNEIHLKNPKTVLSPLAEQLPDVDEIIDIDLPDSGGTTTDPSNEETTESDNSEITDVENPTTGDSEISDPGPIGGDNTGTSNPYVDENGNLIKHDIELNTENQLGITYADSIKITLNGQEMEVTSDNAVEFIKWLHQNYKEDSEISIEIEGGSNEIGEPVYNTTMEDISEVHNLVASINVVDSLPDGDDYDRNTYERPVQSYELNGERVNRNDYAWMTSPWFDEETFTYTCPYTGAIIHDLDDEEEDYDFGTLDYDHIVPLKSAYIRGASEWTEEQMNEYSYNQWIGVDVLYSANRSKSDKGPCEYMPDINQEDYCYSWLMICSYYQLSMTQEEIDLCVNTIETAVENGETVIFLGGSMPE